MTARSGYIDHKKPIYDPRSAQGQYYPIWKNLKEVRAKSYCREDYGEKLWDSKWNL